MCEPNSHHLGDSRWQVTVFIIAVNDRYFDDLAFLTVAGLEARVLYISRLFTEDRAQEFLLSGEFRLALRGYLADQNVAAANPSALDYNAVLIQIGELAVANVGDVTRNLLIAQLRLSGLDFALLDVDRRVAVILDQVLTQDDGIFEVSAAPAHEADEQILTQRKRAAIGGRRVRQRLTCLDSLSLLHDGMLIKARGLVGPCELRQRDAMTLTVFSRNLDRVGRGTGDDAIRVGHGYLSRIRRSLSFQTRTYDWLLRQQQRHALALHVGTHQRTRGIIVLQERDQTGGDRYRLVWRNVEVVDIY